MSYVKTDWTEKVPVTAERLNKMEKGIQDAHDVIEKAGQPNGFATLDEDGMIPDEQVRKMEQIKVYTLTGKEGCKAIYGGSRAITKGEMCILIMDMTFAKDAAQSTRLHIATVGKIPPGKVINKNIITNLGKRCYLNILETGEVYVIATDALSEGDGIRTEVMYFIGH